MHRYGPRPLTPTSVGLRAGQAGPQPQTLFTEMSAGESIVSQSHAVAQFQVFVQGSGNVGLHDTRPITLQYVDRHTGYGPIQAGAHGLAYLVLRARTETKPVYLDRPRYPENLKPSKQRMRRFGPLVLSTDAVRASRSDPMMEPLFDEKDCTDGMGAFMLRLGGGKATHGPELGRSGGCYVVVLAGTLV